MSNTSFSSAARVLFVFAALTIVLAGIRAAESIMVTFLLSGFFAIICAPPFMFMMRKGLPAWLSLVLVVLVISLIQLLFIGIIGSSVDEFTKDLPFYQERMRTLTGQFLDTLTGFGIEVPKSEFQNYFDPSMAFNMAAAALGNLGTVLSNSFLIILTVIFMLFEGASLPAKLERAFGKNSDLMSHIDRFLNNVKRYMTIKTVISIATGAIIYIWLKILDVDYPLVWALVAFLFNFVPNIGSIIAAVPAVLLALVQLGPLYAVLTGAGYIVTNTVMGNMVEPRYLGQGLGLSTLVVFLSLVFWGWLLGPVGMLLSVPLTMLLKIAFESSEETQWLAIIMGGDEPERTDNQIE